MKRHPRNLVLFDIDGTLIRGKVHKDIVGGIGRFAYSVKKTFGLNVNIGPQHMGQIDKQIYWELVSSYGVSRQDYLNKYPILVERSYEYLIKIAQKRQLYEPIADAVKFVYLLSEQDVAYLAVITGNTEKIAWWKLETAGLRRHFHFGLFGDEADNRIDLAKKVLPRARRKLRREFTAEQVIMVGDTVHDIRAGKAIGARSIAVATGVNSTKKVLAGERPDLLVDSLMDKRVHQLLGLK